MRKYRLILPIVFVLLLLLLAGGVLASSSQMYSIDRQILSAGGAPAVSSSGHVSMNGSLGQTAIGVSSGGQTTLWAGFWQRVQQVMWDLFLPIITRFD